MLNGVRRLDRVKILVWDRNGFVLYYSAPGKSLGEGDAMK
jgi:hypothetical protein